MSRKGFRVGGPFLYSLDMSIQHELSQILKSKGVGPEGSRSLNFEQIQFLNTALVDPQVSKTTIATLLTAFLMLDNTPEESLWLSQSFDSNLWPQEMSWMWRGDQEVPAGILPRALRGTLQKKELEVSQARAALAEILNMVWPDWMGGAFLEAMRLKRETYAENQAFWGELLAQSANINVNVPHLLDLADPYDGLNRSVQLSPFVACVLAELGYPVLLHGGDAIPPKEGLTARAVLSALGIEVDQPLQVAGHRIENKDLGWAYVDQSIYFPVLSSLRTLRKEMVKRPFLATFEKMLSPLRAHSNQMVIGYTHKAYRTLLANLLNDNSIVDKFVVVRGVEGASRPSSARASLYAEFRGGELIEGSWDPQELGYVFEEEKLVYLSAQEMAELGVAALSGRNPEIAKLIEIQVCFVLDLVYGVLDQEMHSRVREVLGSGAAIRRLS